MRWPFRRRGRSTAAATETPRRPSREWAGLAPLRPVGLRPEPEVADAGRFQARLATRWQQPPILAPLGHELNLAAPAGLSVGVVAPVEGYAGAPELRWAEHEVPHPLPQLPVVGTATGNERAGAVRDEPVTRPVVQPLLPTDAHQPVTAASVSSPVTEPATAIPPGAGGEPVPPPAAVPPAKAPPPHAEPPRTFRRLGRIGPPLHVDAVPPAVVRAAADPVEPTAPTLPMPPTAQPAPEPMRTPPPVPADGLGVPDWFARPGANDPDNPVAARWVAPISAPEPEPTHEPPPTNRVLADPVADAPFRPFRRFGAQQPRQPGRQAPLEPPAVEAPLAEQPPLASVPESHPDARRPPAEPPAELVAPEPAGPVAPPPVAPEPAPPRPIVTAELVPPAPARSLASARQPLSFLPAAPLSLLPGLVPEWRRVDASPRAATAPTVEPGPEAEPAPPTPMLEPVAEPWAGYPPPAPHLIAMPTQPPGELPALPPMPGLATPPGEPSLAAGPPWPGRAAAPKPGAPPPAAPDLAALFAFPSPAQPPPPEAVPESPLPRAAAPVLSGLRRHVARLGAPLDTTQARHAGQPADLVGDGLTGLRTVAAAALPTAFSPAPPVAAALPGAVAGPPDPGPPPDSDDADVGEDADPDEETPLDGERLDGLAGQLYDRIRDRLRRELLVDRERSLMLTDWR